MTGPSSSSWWERFSGWLLGKVGPSLVESGLPIVSSSSLQLRLLDDMTTKADRIEACLAQNPVNLWELRELALSKGGLLTPQLRQKAWPLLVGLPSPSTDNNASTSPRHPSSSSRSNQPNENIHQVGGSNSGSSRTRSSAALADSTNISNPPYSYHHESAEEEKKMVETYEASWDLIQRDVGRSVVFRYKGTTIPTYATERLAKALDETIKSSSLPSAPAVRPKALLPPRTATSGSSSKTAADASRQQQQQQQAQQKQPPLPPTPPHYHYYQGLHDIAGVILHQLDYNADLGTSILQRLAQSHWRDALRENFGNLTFILNLCLPLLEQVEPFVHYQLQMAQLEISNLILPWMITWFTHDIFHADTAGRLVDALMASHPLMPLYFSVALLTHPRCKPELLEADTDDPASLFVILKQFPKYICSDDIDHNSNSSHGHDRRVTVQELLDDALSILHKFPPRTLLDLVDPQVSPRANILQRANTISMFQAVRSWNLTTYAPPCTNNASSTTSSAVLPKQQNVVLLGPSTSHTYLRAKLASGVPLLITTVGPQWNLVRRRVRRQRRQLLEEEAEAEAANDEELLQPKKQRPRSSKLLQKLRRVVLGK